MKTFQLLHGFLIFDNDKITIVDHESNGKKWLTILSNFTWIIFFAIQTIKNIQEIRQHNNNDSSDLYLNLTFLTIGIAIGIYLLLKKTFQSKIDISEIVAIKHAATLAEGTPIVKLTLANNRVRKLYFAPNDDLSFIEILSQKLKK